MLRQRNQLGRAVAHFHFQTVTLQLLAEPQVFQSFSSAVTSTFTPNLTIYSTASIPNISLAAAMSVVLALATFVLSFTVLKLTQRRTAA